MSRGLHSLRLLLGATLLLTAACGQDQPTASSDGATALRPGGVVRDAFPDSCTDQATCVGSPRPETVRPEETIVCKKYPVGVTGPAVQIKLDVVSTNTDNNSPTSLVFTVQPNSCLALWWTGGKNHTEDAVTVEELVPAGYTAQSQVTLGVNNSSGVFTIGTPAPATSATIITTATGGPSLKGALVVFTNTPIPQPELVSIGNFVWNDANANGVQDNGEVGIPGVTVTLDGTTSITTDANGGYLFSNLPAGTHTVNVGTPPGFTPSPSNVGSPNTDSNVSGAPVTVLTGTDDTIDFGFYLPPTYSLGDFVWNDADGDGVQDAGEPGIAGATVTLSNGGTTTTNASGFYTFGGLPAGTYTACVSGLSAGFVQTYDLDGLATPNCATASVGPSRTDVDFGYRLNACPAALIGSLVGAGVTNDLFLFTDGSTDANWQGASKGFVGNAVVNGTLAKERTSGSFAFAGTISTNDATLSAWQSIVNNNPGQAFAATGQTAVVAQRTAALNSAFTNINALPVTPGYASRASTSLNGLNTQNGVPETIVINVSSGLQVSSQINITGDAGDLFILRWDTDQNFANGYQGQVKFQSGGAIVPKGGLTAANFLHVAGDINASGGGSTPASPYPQGPRFNNGTGALATGAANFNGGGFFTGYWFTTGDPSDRQTSSLSNAIFVGGWYSTTTKFSMTSGTSGVHVSCP